MLFPNLIHFLLVRKITPFIGILMMVIEFLRVVGIANISPAIGTEAKTADMVQVSNRHMRPLGPRVGKQRHKAWPIMHFTGWQTAKLKESWGKADQTDRA